MQEMKKVLRIPSGVAVVDKLLGGLDVGVIGLLGPTGGGKTTLAMQIAYSAAQEAGRHARFVMCDGQSDTYHVRMASLGSGLAVKEIERAQLDPNVADLAQKGFDRFNEWVRVTDYPLHEGVGYLRRILEEDSRKDALPCLLVVDQLLPLAYARYSTGSAPLHVVIQVIIEDLRILSEVYCLPVIVPHQMKPPSRDDDTSPTQIPGLHQAQECSSWANGIVSGMALGMLDDHYRCWLAAPKVRHGASGQEIVTLNGAYARFECEQGPIRAVGRRFVNKNEIESHEQTEGEFF